MKMKDWMAKREAGDWSANNEVPQLCRRCRFRYLDIEESHLCTSKEKGIMGQIRLPSGRTVGWPGRDVRDAWQDCRGKGYNRRTFGLLAYYGDLYLMKIGLIGALSCVIMLLGYQIFK